MTSLHTLTIPPLIRGLHNVKAILKKAQASDIDASTIFSSRIHSDMLPFTTQIFFICYIATRIPTDMNPLLPSASLGPPEDPPTFDAFFARIAKTIDYLESIRPEDLNGREGETVKLRIERKDLGNVAYVEHGMVEYVGFAGHPNFWFHVTTAYDLLRGVGLDIGKFDFLNASGLHTWRFEKE